LLPRRPDLRASLWLYSTIRKVTGTKVPSNTARYAAKETSRPARGMLVMACSDAGGDGGGG
jgi:hypothetical protein